MHVETLSLMRLRKQIGCHARTIVGKLFSWRLTGGAKSLKCQLRTSENARLRPSTESSLRRFDAFGIFLLLSFCGKGWKKGMETEGRVHLSLLCFIFMKTYEDGWVSVYVDRLKGHMHFLAVVS